MLKKTPPGFTILELLVITAILGTLAALLAPIFSSIAGTAKVTLALEEMNNIKTSVRDLFYPDLGVVPQDPGKDGMLVSKEYQAAWLDDRPWFATRYLCLRDDRADPGLAPNPIENPEADAMWYFLRACHYRSDPKGKIAAIPALANMVWDRYKQKGWRGPYMEMDAVAKLKGDDAYAMPLINTPWADSCEDMARQAEEKGDDNEAEILRRGKYYLITADVEVDASGNYKTDKDTARVISFGADCLDSGSYLRTDLGPGAKKTPTTITELRKLNKDDSLDPDSYYTGDDVVVFIFGGGVMRKPANKTEE